MKSIIKMREMHIVSIFKMKISSIINIKQIIQKFHLLQKQLQKTDKKVMIYLISSFHLLTAALRSNQSFSILTPIKKPTALARSTSKNSQIAMLRITLLPNKKINKISIIHLHQHQKVDSIRFHDFLKYEKKSQQQVSLKTLEIKLKKTEISTLVISIL